MPMSLPRPQTSALLAIFLFALSTAQAAPPPILPFSQVRSGMKGTGKTVFHGETVETFDVEIVGVLPNIGPGQHLILARCSGGPLAETGTLAGMSGSPATIDGKLVGAIAYSWGFTKDAIAGITPIEEMLAVGTRESSPLRKPRPSAALPWSDALRHLRSPSALGDFFVSRLAALATRPVAATATVPLAVSGIDAAGLARMAPDLARAGFMVLPSGSPGKPTPATATAPIEPGSAIGVQLTRGDVDMTATGTATWVDGDALYAFGHPLYGLGDVDIPLTAARVETLL